MGGDRHCRKPDKKKPEKLSAEERKQRKAALENLAARMCPPPAQEPTKKKLSADERARRLELKRVKEAQVQTFLDNYEEDLHRRRINVKQAKRRARLADESHARAPRMDRKSLLGL